MLDPVKRAFVMMVAMQAAEAQHGLALADLLKATPSVSKHPSSGPRKEADELVAIFDNLVIPAGQGASRWAGEEMTRAEEALHGLGVLAAGGKDGVSATFPFDRLTSLLVLDTTYRHPRLGAGLHASLRLPVPIDVKDDEAMRAVGWMNEIELSTMPLHNFQGAWCVSPDQKPCFKVFYPNVMFRPGLSVNLVMQMARRAASLRAIDPCPAARPRYHEPT